MRDDHSSEAKYLLAPASTRVDNFPENLHKCLSTPRPCPDGVYQPCHGSRALTCFSPFKELP